MKLRYLKDISVTKAIIHVLDKGGDEAILNSDLLDIQDAFLQEFIAKHIVKSLNNDHGRKIVFQDDEFIVHYLKKLMMPDEFVNGSQKIAKKLFELIRVDESIPSSDLLICEAMHDNGTFYGIMKLDYQPSYTHKIDFVDEKLQVSLIPHNIALPSAKQKLKECIFVQEIDGNYSGIVIDQKKTSDNDYKKNYFVKEFLKANYSKDSTQQTKTLKNEAEKWVRKNLKEDIEKATEFRKEINKSLIEEDAIALNELADKVLSVEEKQDIKKHMEKKGVVYEEPVHVDKKWVDKKLKSKSLKTDTGVTIRGKFEVFNDSNLFEVKENGDGSVDYIIKNVRNISER